MRLIISIFVLINTSKSLLSFPAIVPQQDKTVKELIALAEESEKSGNANQAVYYYDKVANIYWKLGGYNNAQVYFEKALENVVKVGNKNGEKVLYTNLGFLFVEQSDYPKAIKSFEKALGIASAMGKKLEVGQILLNISNAQIEQGEYQMAIAKLNQAQSIAQEVGDLKLLRNIYYNFNRAYDKLSNPEKAQEYFNFYAALTKKIQAEEIRQKEQLAKAMVDSAGRVVQQFAQEKDQTVKKLAETSKELQARKQTLQDVEKQTREQQMQIDLLNAEMQLRDVEIRHQKLLQQVYIGIIVISLVIAAVISYLYIGKRKANRMLAKKNAEISQQRDAISRQAEELRELNALKDKLFSIIAHDLRSPLFSLITMLNIAKEGHFSPENFKQVLDELSVNVNHTTALLENLLTWAKNQMQGTKVNPQNFDLHELVNSKILLLNDAATSKEVKLINSVPEGAIIYADKDMTDIVVHNLISNAIKFCNAGDKINVWSFTGGGTVTVCVEDTGIGMPPEVMEKLFGSQITSTPGTRNEKGTGLGLILCKEFIEMNGGEIWADSQLGKGSKFFFSLPAIKV